MRLIRYLEINYPTLHILIKLYIEGNQSKLIPAMVCDCFIKSTVTNVHVCVLSKSQLILTLATSTDNWIITVNWPALHLKFVKLTWELSFSPSIPYVCNSKHRWKIISIKNLLKRLNINIRSEERWISQMWHFSISTLIWLPG